MVLIKEIKIKWNIYVIYLNYFIFLIIYWNSLLKVMDLMVEKLEEIFRQSEFGTG